MWSFEEMKLEKRWTKTAFSHQILFVRRIICGSTDIFASNRTPQTEVSKRFWAKFFRSSKRCVKSARAVKRKCSLMSCQKRMDKWLIEKEERKSKRRFKMEEAGRGEQGRREREPKNTRIIVQRKWWCVRNALIFGSRFALERLCARLSAIKTSVRVLPIRRFHIYFSVCENINNNDLAL